MEKKIKKNYNKPMISYHKKNLKITSKLHNSHNKKICDKQLTQTKIFAN